MPWRNSFDCPSASEPTCAFFLFFRAFSVFINFFFFCGSVNDSQTVKQEMGVFGAFELTFFNRRKSKIKKKFGQSLVLVLMSVLLWAAPGLAEDRPPLCHPEDFGPCSSPCAFVRSRCQGDSECSAELCSHLYPVCHPQMNCPKFLHMCWDLFSECSDTSPQDMTYAANKRSILNKSVAYLLLKLHPYLNQTSQFSFLTPGRIRRITGNFGTEFLGKRSNNKSKGRGRLEPTKTPTTARNFLNLPLNGFAKAKIPKRSYAPPEESKRGDGRVVLGSEFLGKRAGELEGVRPRRVVGTELLGKRRFDGSELLGKREGWEEDVVSGSELLGKKSNEEYLRKRYTGSELLGRKRSGLAPGGGSWTDDDPDMIDEAFYNYDPFPKGKMASCSESESCESGRRKEQREISQ